MAFYFRTDRNFSASNPSSNTVPTNGVSVYIGGSPGSNSLYDEENRLEVHFDGVLNRRFQVIPVEDDEWGTINSGDLSCSISTNGNSLVYTLEPVKIPNDAQTMLLKVWVWRSGEIYSYEQTFTFNSPPEISGSDSDLGVKNSAFTVDFSVDDANSSDVLSVTGILNGEVIYNADNVERNKTYALEITNAMLSAVDIGARNEIVIEVSDTKATTKRIYSFVKEINLDTYCEYETVPIIVASRPACIIVGQSISCTGGVDVKVYVTNNALDNNPKWEDMSEAYRKGSVYYFTNRSCSSDKYAIALRFINAKEDADSVITVSGLGFVTDVTVIGDDGLPYQLPGFSTDYTTGNTHTLTWVNPEKSFTATKIVRAKNWTPLTVDDGDVIYDGTGTSIADTFGEFDETYFDPEVYWNMIDNKQYDYWTNVAVNKPEGKSVDGDMYVYRKFPYGDGGIQTQEYNGVVSIVCRGEKYPYPENSITIDESYSAEHGSIDIPVIGHIPGNMVNFKCERGEGRAVIATGEFIEDNAVIRVSAVRPGFSELIAYTGALSQETRATIRVCDRLYLKINTSPYLAIGGERGYVSYKVTNSLGEDLTDKCLLHYSSETKQIHDDFTVNILGGGNAEIIYNKDATSKINLSQYHFWVEINGKNYEKESKIYLRSYGIEV